MAKCLRCGRELSQPKCEQCGFDPRSGVRLLTRWNGKYDIPKVEAKAPVQTTPSLSPAPTSVLTSDPTSAPDPQTQSGSMGVDPRAQQKREDLKKWMMIIGFGLAALAGLAALIFGVVKLVNWMGTFSGMTWKMIIGAVVAMVILTVTVIVVGNTHYDIHKDGEGIAVLILSAINFVLMLVFPEVYRPVGAVVSLGLSASCAYRVYKLIDNWDFDSVAGEAALMIANLLLFPHLWGVSWLGWGLYLIAVSICYGLASIYDQIDGRNPFVLQSVLVGIVAVLYLVGFLTIPHFMHALNAMPEVSGDRSIGQEKVEAECFCGDTVELDPYSADSIHFMHCIFKFKLAFLWEGDETGHWQICTCGETFNYQEHIWNGEGRCDLCKYPSDGTESDGETGEMTSAADFDELFAFQYDENDGLYVIEGYLGDEEAECLFIPAKYESKLVAVGEQAFRNKEFRTVELSVSYIGKEGFSYCGQLEEANITAQYVGENAFFGCEKLERVVMGEVVTLGEYAFGNCSELTTIELPFSLREIGRTTFTGCGFSEIVIPPGVEKIGEYTFVGCEKLHKVVLTGNLLQIGVGVFDECPSLSQIFYHGTRDQWDALDWPEKEQYEPIVTFIE